MQIFTASAADAETFAQLNRHVHQLHVKEVPSFFKTVTDAQATEAFRELLSKEDAHGFLAQIEGEAVGYMLFFVRETPPNAFCRARRWIYLDSIFRAPQSKICDHP